VDLRIPQEVKNLSNEFKDRGFELYLVGGAVRDFVMEKDITDWDFATNAIPEQILDCLGEEAFYDNRFGTVGFPFKDGRRPFEITTYRTEYGYSDSRRPDKIKWGKSLEEDLKRRDFTINAMALRLAPITQDKQEIIDLYEGKKDIKRKLIRAVGDPTERFSEDALRMMRAVRIAAELGFTIEENTFNAIKMHADSINKIARERVREELFKIIRAEYAYEAMVLFHSTGLMDETLPELSKTFGVEQKSPGRHHIYDVGKHLLMSLKHCPSQDIITRFATLIHDIGKPQTYKIQDGVITFYNHEVIGARIAKNIATRLRFSKKDSDKLWRLVRWHQFTVDEKQTDKAIRRFISKVGLELVEDMLALRTGDRLGGGARETSWRTEEFKKRLVEVQKQPFTVHDLKIKGDDIMRELNLKPGPRVGEVLNKLFEDVTEKKVENTRKALLASLKSLSLPSSK
jgi:putative nucleotidyltransferase with HDIG domain